MYIKGIKRYQLANCSSSHHFPPSAAISPYFLGINNRDYVNLPPTEKHDAALGPPVFPALGNPKNPESHGKSIGKPWENHGKNGNIMGKPWKRWENPENHGKSIGKPATKMGKSWEIMGISGKSWAYR